MGKDEGGPSYRWAAFTHWINWAVLGAGAVAGAAIDPALWAAIVPAELAVLWVLPDVPTFRMAVDERHKQRSLLAERAFYLEQLWGLAPREPKSWGDRVLGAFVQRDVDDFDERVITRGGDFQKYLEIREIVAKLREMSTLPGSRLRARDVLRFEHVVNAYLGLLVAVKTLGSVCQAIDRPRLESELAELADHIAIAEHELRPVLGERQRLLQTQLDRLPKLQATLQLLRARVDAIEYQLRNIESQVVAFPGSDVHGMLDEIIERNEILADPLAELGADQEIRKVLNPGAAPASASSSKDRTARAAAAARSSLKH